MASTLLAMLVRHRNRWTVAVLNALLGWTILGSLLVLDLLVWPLTWHGQLSRQIDDVNDKLEELRAAESAQRHCPANAAAQLPLPRGLSSTTTEPAPIYAAVTPL